MIYVFQRMLQKYYSVSYSEADFNGMKLFRKYWIYLENNELKNWLFEKITFFN